MFKVTVANYNNIYTNYMLNLLTLSQSSLKTLVTG